MAVAGSGALLAAAACTSSSSSGSVAGSVTNPDSGYEDTSVDQAADSTGPMPEAGSDGPLVDGLVTMPDGPMGLVDGSGGEDSPSTFDGPVGVVANPDSGTD